MNPNPSLNGFFMKDRQDISLAGTNDEIRFFGEKLLSEEPITIPLHVPDDSPSPYDGYLTDIQMVSSHGPLQIALNESTLVIDGAPENRRLLAALILQTTRHVDNCVDFTLHRLQVKPASQHPFLDPAALTMNIDIIDLGIGGSEVDAV